MVELRSAVAEEIPWLTDTFIDSLRDAITEARGYWDDKKERDQSIRARASGAPVRFSVLKSNRAARRFYERLGCRWLSSSERHDLFEWAADQRTS